MTRSSYTLTATCAERRAAGHRGAVIARAVGRSETWVSRHLAAWDNASGAVRLAWADGALTDDAVLKIAALSVELQSDALAHPPKSRRGAAARPQADAIKRAIVELDAYGNGSKGDDYAKGALDALRWVTGSMPTRLAEILRQP